MSPAAGISRRDSCRACRGGNLHVFLDFGDMPLAGDFRLESELAATARYPMDLAVCMDCSMVQILNVVPPNVLFTDYRYLSSVTRTLSQHFRDYAAFLKRRILPNGQSYVFEFGSNDGVLLAPLREMGVDAVGMDAAANIVEVARRRGLEVMQGYFGRDAARRVLEQKGPAAVVTASNVFAHIDDLDEILGGVDILLDRDGSFIVEVHYVVDLIATFQFDTVYHEHLSYFSLHALKALYERHGFAVVGLERLPMHGGSIRVIAKRAQEARVVEPVVEKTLEDEREFGLLSAELYERFGQSVNAHRDRLRTFVLQRKAGGGSMAAFGAAGRATILLNYCDFGSDVIDYVVDESVARIGRYVPGVALPVVSREHFHESYPDNCLITAWNYRDEIVAKERDYLRQGGVFILPLPEIELITHEPS